MTHNDNPKSSPIYYNQGVLIRNVGAFLLEYLLDHREGQINHKNDAHDTNVPFQIVPSGNRTFFDTCDQSFKKRCHTLILFIIYFFHLTKGTVPFVI